jgi:hypothetical protein
VKLLRVQLLEHDVYMPVGTRGVVTRVDMYGGAPTIRVEITDARDEDGRMDHAIGKTLLVSDMAFASIEDILAPLVDNWASAATPMKRSALPSSQKRTSRPLKRNVKPSVPHPGFRGGPSPAVTQWVAVTFAPGTPVKFLSIQWAEVLEPGSEGTEVVRPGARGEVVRFDGVYLIVRVVDARDEIGNRTGAVGWNVHVRDIDADKALEPLVDNWPAAQGKYRRSGKITPNTIPPPPRWQDWDDFLAWAKRTYAAGTRVRLIEDRWSEDDNLIPSGSTGRVTVASGHGVTVEFVKQVPLFTSVSSTTMRTSMGFSSVEEYLEPLDDNWGPLVIPSKRHSPPPQRGWQKQLSASRSLRARKVQPNGGKRVSQRGGSDMRRIEDAAREQGWSVDRTRSGHLVFISPDKSVPPVHTGSDIGDPRALKNIEARLRRAGLDVGKRPR